MSEMSSEKHHYQWDSTENALAFINFTVAKNKNSFDAEKVFLNTPCFVTEKYDGTNLAKDDMGTIYSRRFALGDDEQEFIKTSLKNVREADVNLFKSSLCETAGLDPNNIVKCIVYGEFICNAYYDYEKRGLIGNWKVFAAKLEVKEDGPAILDKFRELGFAVPKRSGNPCHVKLYGNEKFFELAKQAELDVPDFRGTDVSFAKMVEMNKDDMKTGRIEGLVITLNTDESGYKFIKWNGSQEFQPHAHTNFQKANDKIQNSSTHEDIRKAFDTILEISQNEQDYLIVRKSLTVLKNLKRKLESLLRTLIQAGDIEVNPGPPEANLHFLEKYPGYPFTVQKDYFDFFITQLEDLSKSARKDAVSPSMYTEENLRILLDLLRMFVRGKGKANANAKAKAKAKVWVKYLVSHWYKKVKEKEEAKNEEQDAVSTTGTQFPEETFVERVRPVQRVLPFCILTKEVQPARLVEYSSSEGEEEA